jgi:uncharacterized protein (DUF488 family)
MNRQEIFTIGYGNQSIDRIIDAMQGHPNTILVDVRRYPFSQNRPDFNRENLKQRFGERYISDRYLGNGAKGGVIEGKWLVSGIWYANIHDMPVIPDSHEAMIEALIQHMQRFKETIDARQAVPMFFCSERKPEYCHRTDVANLAVEQVWEGYEIAHL